MSEIVKDLVPENLFEEVQCVEGAPHVHLHFLTTDADYHAEQKGRVEIVCHGCGASLLLIYEPSTQSRGLLGARRKFVKAHQTCTAPGADHNCWPYRSSFHVMDLRRGFGGVMSRTVSKGASAASGGRPSKGAKKSSPARISLRSPLKSFETEAIQKGMPSGDVIRSLRRAMSLGREGRLCDALRDLVLPLRDAIASKRVPANGSYSRREDGASAISWMSVRGRLYQVAFVNMAGSLSSPSSREALPQDRPTTPDSTGRQRGSGWRPRKGARAPIPPRKNSRSSRR